MGVRVQAQDLYREDSEGEVDLCPPAKDYTILPDGSVSARKGRSLRGDLVAKELAELRYLVQRDDRFGRVLERTCNAVHEVVASRNPTPVLSLLAGLVWNSLCIAWEVDSHRSSGVPKAQLRAKTTELQDSLTQMQADFEAARRRYLKEIVSLRDQIRRLEPCWLREVAKTVHEEEPVMFYEPLQYLSEELRHHISEIVEEKLKLLLFRLQKPGGGWYFSGQVEEYIQQRAGQTAEELDRLKEEKVELRSRYESSDKRAIKLEDEIRRLKTHICKMREASAHNEADFTQLVQAARREMLDLESLAKKRGHRISLPDFDFEDVESFSFERPESFDQSSLSEAGYTVSVQDVSQNLRHNISQNLPTIGPALSGPLQSGPLLSGDRSGHFLSTGGDRRRSSTNLTTFIIETLEASAEMRKELLLDSELGPRPSISRKNTLRVQGSKSRTSSRAPSKDRHTLVEELSIAAEERASEYKAEAESLRKKWTWAEEQLDKVRYELAKERLSSGEKDEKLKNRAEKLSAIEVEKERLNKELQRMMAAADDSTKGNYAALQELDVLRASAKEANDYKTRSQATTSMQGKEIAGLKAEIRQLQAEIQRLQEELRRQKEENSRLRTENIALKTIPSEKLAWKTPGGNVFSRLVKDTGNSNEKHRMLKRGSREIRDTWVANLNRRNTRRLDERYSRRRSSEPDLAQVRRVFEALEGEGGEGGDLDSEGEEAPAITRQKRKAALSARVLQKTTEFEFPEPDRSPTASPTRAVGVRSSFEKGYQVADLPRQLITDMPQQIMAEDTGSSGNGSGNASGNGSANVFGNELQSIESMLTDSDARGVSNVPSNGNSEKPAFSTRRTLEQLPASTPAATEAWQAAMAAIGRAAGLHAGNPEWPGLEGNNTEEEETEEQPYPLRIEGLYPQPQQPSDPAVVASLQAIIRPGSAAALRQRKPSSAEGTLALDRPKSAAGLPAIAGNGATCASANAGAARRSLPTKEFQKRPSEKELNNQARRLLASSPGQQRDEPVQWSRSLVRTGSSPHLARGSLPTPGIAGAKVASKRGSTLARGGGHPL